MSDEEHSVDWAPAAPGGMDELPLPEDEVRPKAKRTSMKPSAALTRRIVVFQKRVRKADKPLKGPFKLRRSRIKFGHPEVSVLMSNTMHRGKKTTESVQKQLVAAVRRVDQHYTAALHNMDLMDKAVLSLDIMHKRFHLEREYKKALKREEKAALQKQKAAQKARRKKRKPKTTFFPAVGPEVKKAVHRNVRN